MTEKQRSQDEEHGAGMPGGDAAAGLGGEPTGSEMAGTGAGGPGEEAFTTMDGTSPEDQGPADRPGTNDPAGPGS